jgi:hypothetical protein
VHFTQSLPPPDCLCAKSSGSSHIPPEIEMMKMLPDFAQQRRFGDAQFYWGNWFRSRRNRPQGALLGWLGVLGVPDAAHLPIRAAATGQYPNPAFNG